MSTGRLLRVGRGGIGSNRSWARLEDPSSLPSTINENLYFLFEGVRHGSRRLFPEIFIDPRNLKSTGWEKGRWWLHVSYNLCEGDGEPNVYTKAGVFQCAHQKSGWDGNNPPEAETQDVEIRVSFSKIRIMPTSEFRLGLALAVTDATGDAHEMVFLAPKGRY